MHRPPPLLMSDDHSQNADTFTAVHGRVLELIASGAPLRQTLDELVQVVEAASNEGMRASILLVDDDGLRLRHASAPSLPEAYNRAIDGIAIGPAVGSCGTAAFRGETVMVSDIDTDPLWKDFRDLAVRFGLRACWSTPVFGADGAVVGTFANYYSEPRDASPRDRELTDLITRTAAIAIDHERRRSRLDREMQRLQRMYTLTGMLGQARSLDEMYEETMSTVQDLLRVHRVSILLFDPDGVMRFKAWRGLSDDYRRAVEGHTPWKPEDVNAAPIVVPDVFADAGLAPYAPLFQREAIGGLAFFPLRTRKVLGKFMAYFDEPRSLTEDEIRAAEAVAHHMAFAVERAQREETLQRASSIMSAVFDQTTDAVFVKDRLGRYVMVNGAAAKVAGVEPSHMIGRTAAEIFPSPTGEAIMARDADLMAAASTRSIEEPIRFATGERTFLSAKGPWRDGEGNVIGLIGISRDITDRIRAEEDLRRRARQQAALAELGVLALSDIPLQSLIERAVSAARELLGGDCAELRDLGSAGERAPVRSGDWADDGTAARLGSIALETSTPVAVSDFDRDERFAGGAPRLFRSGISAACAIGERHATLTVVARTPADYSPDDAHFVRSLAGTLGMAIEHRAIGEASRESEERFRSLSACSPTGIFLTDVQGRCSYTNASCQQICGFTREEALGSGWTSFVHPEDREAVLESWTRTAVSGADFGHVLRFVHQDGSVRWTHVRTAPVLGDRNQLIGHAGTVEDITATREMTEALLASEERYRSLVNATAQVVWTATPEDLLHDTWRQLTGRPGGEEHRWLDAVHPDDREPTRAAVQRALAGGHPWEVEYRLRVEERGYRYFICRAVPVRNTDGSIREWVGTCSDIDDRRRGVDAIELLSEASAVLGSSLVLDQTLGALVRVVVARGADLCAIVLGSGGEAAVRELAHRDGGEEARLRDLLLDLAREPLRRVMSGGRAELLSAGGEAEPPDGLGTGSVMLLPLAVRSRILGALVIGAHDAGGYDGRDVAVAEELASRVALAIDNATLYAEAQAASRAKDDFLATLSHELRTPMTAILGWTRLLQLGGLDDDTVRIALESLDSSTRAQAQIVEDILDVSRIITGKLVLEPSPLPIASILRAAADAVRPAAEAKSITLAVSVPRSVPKVAGDPTRVRQIVWNLLSNAIKFTPAGGRVEVTLGREEESARISVADTGEGIAPELLPHIFDRFRQGDSSSTRAHGGLGLGLAIVRHLVELHGGTVTAESAGRKRGATFTVRLPCAPAAQAAPRRAPRRGRTDAGPRLPSLRRTRVLVVDDEEQTRIFLSTMLTQCGAEVRATASVADALSTLATWNPHVVVSDLAMPHEGGYDLISRLRVRGERRRRPRITAIALTAYGRPEDRDRALAAGFDHFLQKPIEPLALARAIAAATPRRKATTTAL